MQDCVTCVDNELVLGKQAVAEGVCKPGEIEIEVLACALGLVDLQLWAGALPEVASETAFVGGHAGVCGRVVRRGAGVEHVPLGCQVVGLLDLSGHGGLCERLRADARFFMPVSDKVDPALAAGIISPGLQAVEAMHYGARLLRGQSVLVTHASSPAGEIAVQLARIWELNVLVHCASHAEATLLEARFPGITVLEGDDETLQEKVLDATNGLGVDCVYESQVEADTNPKWRRGRLGCVGPRGRWCVAQEMQLDQPESRALMLRGAGLHHVFVPVWTLYPLQLGRFLHVLRLLGEWLPQLTLSQLDRFPLARTAQARDAVARGDVSVVVTLGKHK